MRRRFLWLITNTLNRWTTRLARAGRGPFSLVRHVGRKSGKPYETPIIVVSRRRRRRLLNQRDDPGDLGP